MTHSQNHKSSSNNNQLKTAFPAEVFVLLVNYFDQHVYVPLNEFENLIYNSKKGHFIRPAGGFLLCCEPLIKRQVI